MNGQFQGFFSVDQNFIITSVNSRHVELIKVPRENQIGQYFFDLFPDAKNPNSKYWIDYHHAMNNKVTCELINH